jgi:homogentisate 1,2-dioxygenase
MPRTTLHNIPEKHGTFKSYRYQLSNMELPKGKKFTKYVAMMFSPHFKMIFSHEALFLLSGKAHRYNMQIWESNNPNEELSIRETVQN